MIDETLKEDGKKCKEASEKIKSKIEMKPLPQIEEVQPKVYKKGRKK